MATLNLGRIKPVFRGAYNGATAYVVDDIVTSGGETFICILAYTGNATSNATYWTKLAEKGTNGTDGTDVGATLTTQGDILYRDGSGLQRLGAGTSGQFLKTQGTGANPVWGDVTAGSHTKIAEFTSSGTPTEFVLDNIFTSTYDLYMIYVTNYLHVSNNLQWYMKLRTGGSSGSTDTSSNYRGMVYYTRRTAGTETSAADGFWDTNHYRIANYDLSADTNKGSFIKLYIANPYNSNRHTSFYHEGLINHADITSIVYTNGSCVYNSDVSHTGISFTAQDSGNKVANGNKAFVYGIKY